MTAAVEELGGKVLFHGLNIRPGKPTIFATLWGKPVFGLPGHPVSCAMVVLRFVLPLLARLKGETGADPLVSHEGETGDKHTVVLRHRGVREGKRGEAGRSTRS